MTYFSEWFDSTGCSIKEPPDECIRDCSGQGRVDEAVDYWVRKLGFEAPAWKLRRYLRGFGAWEPDELCDHQQNLRRLLWTWCGQLSDEGPDVLCLTDY